MILKNKSKRKITLKEFDFIQQNFNKLPFQEIRKTLKVKESTLYDWLLDVFKENHWRLELDNLEDVVRNRFFLVQLPRLFYLVEFDEGVISSTIKFCPIKLGVDYDVSPLSDYEFSRLKKDLHLCQIKISENYKYDFWSTTQFFLQ